MEWKGPRERKQTRKKTQRTKQFFVAGPKSRSERKVPAGAALPFDGLLKRALINSLFSVQVLRT